jgi:DNA-binding response OmpR family regulator
MSVPVLEPRPHAAPRETVLLADPDGDVHATSGALLAHRGYRVLAAYSTGEALRLVSEARPAVAVVEPAALVRAPDEGGRLLHLLRESAGVPVIAFTADDIHFPAPGLLAAGYAAALVKPCRPSEVERQIRMVLDRSAKS